MGYVFMLIPCGQAWRKWFSDAMRYKAEVLLANRSVRRWKARAMAYGLSKWIEHATEAIKQKHKVCV